MCFFSSPRAQCYYLVLLGSHPSLEQALILIVPQRFGFEEECWREVARLQSDVVTASPNQLWVSTKRIWHHPCQQLVPQSLF